MGIPRTELLVTETAHAIVNADDDRDEWRKARQFGIGSSEAPVLFGEGFISPLRLWLQKRGTLEPPNLDEIEAVRWGVLMQDVVATEMWGRMLQCGEWTGGDGAREGADLGRAEMLYQADAWEWLLATPDYWVTMPDGPIVPLEIKTTGVFTGYPSGDVDGYAPFEAFPARVRIQCQQQLMVLGKPYGYLASLVGGQRLVWTRYEADTDMMGAILSFGRNFWQCVQSGDVPELDGSDDERDAIEEWRPPGSDKVLDLSTGEYLDHAVQDALLQKTIKDLDTERKKHTGAIRLAMGEHTKATVGEYVYTLSGGKPRVSWKPEVEMGTPTAGEKRLCVAHLTEVSPSLRRSGGRKGEC